MNILDRLFGKNNKRDTMDNRNRTIKVRLSSMVGDTNRLMTQPINFLIVFVILFVVPILILGTDHIKGITVVFGFMIILIFAIFLLRLFTKNR